VKKKVSISIENDLYEEIQKLRGYLITKTKRGWSFSEVVSILIKEGLRKIKGEKPEIPEFPSVYEVVE